MPKDTSQGGSDAPAPPSRGRFRPMDSSPARSLTDRCVNRFKVLVLTSVAALGIGLVAVLFEKLERMGDLSLGAMSGTAEVFGLRADGAWTWILPAATVVVAMPLIIWLQRRFFPGTEGTGIPQAIAAIRIGASPARSLMLSVRIAIGKILLLAIALLTGITVGREGPSVHVGACFMHLCVRWCRVSPWLMERGLILAGGAAGIAAAFNTPIAGTIFCFEEIGRLFDRKSVLVILRTVALACVIGVVILGDYHFYGNGSIGTALPLAWETGQSFGDWFVGLGPWLAVPVVGLVGGALGGGFGRCVVGGSRRIGPWLQRRPVLTGILLGVGLAAIGIGSGGSSYGGGHSQAEAMLTLASETGATTAVWTDPLGKAAASFIALISMIPGGLFDPSLTVGAGLGQVAHPVFNQWIAPGIDLPALMLLFMAAYFAGVVQSPITVAAILFEMTGAYGMILPLMLTSMFAAMVAKRLCNPSIYDALALDFLERNGLRSAETTPEPAGRSPSSRSR